MVVVFYIICIFGAISHVFLITAFIKDPLKCFKNFATYLVENLVVSDFLTCFFGPFSCCVPTRWYSTCQFIIHTTSSASLLAIVSISIDRFLIVVYPLKHRVVTKGKLLIVWLTCIWLASSIYPAKTYIFKRKSNDGRLIINILGSSLVTSMGIIYGLTYYKLKKQSENCALANVPDRQRAIRVKKEKQFLGTIVLIAGITVFCGGSTAIFHHYAFFAESLRVTPNLDGLFSSIYFFSFAINPLVYVLRFPNYRKTFYLLYCCKSERY